MAAALPATEDRSDRPLSADRVPTLTEVVELVAEFVPPVAVAEVVTAEEPLAEVAPWLDESPLPAVELLQAEAPLLEAPAPVEPVPMPQPAPPAPAPVDPQVLVNQVLAELSPRIELMLEARLREALAPALARAADSLIRDSRQELNSTLHELVREAVARVLQRSRTD